MRALAILAVMSTSASADWEGRLGGMTQGRYQERPRGGVELAFEQRDVISRGVVMTYSVHREEIDDQMGPLEHIVTAGPTTGWAFACDSPSKFVGCGVLRAGLDLAYATGNLRGPQWALLPRVAAEARFFDADGGLIVAFGYAYAIGGDAYRLGGFDMRIGFARFF